MRFCWSKALFGVAPRLLLLLLLLVLVPVPRATDGLETVVRPDSGSSVTISSDRPECSVCEVTGVNATGTTCHQSLALTPEQEVKLQFNCSELQAFSVAVARTIVCTKDSCSPESAAAQNFFSDLPRTYIWELTAPPKTTLSLDPQGKGLSRTTGPCPDGVQLSVSTSKSDPEEQFCRGGSLQMLEVKNGAVVKLKVNPKTTVDPTAFTAAPLKGRTMEVTVGPGTVLVLTRKPSDPECEVCSGGDCSDTGKTITNTDKLQLEFSCSKPQDVFTVGITGKTECTETSCTPVAAEVDPLLFKGFKRTLAWDVSLPPNTVLTLDFPGSGLEETSGSCPDGFQYSVSSSKSGAAPKESVYCRGTSLSSLNLSGQTSVVLELPKDQDLPQTLFTASAAKRGSRLLSVTTDADTKVTIRREPQGPDCDVCVTKDSKQTCSHKQVLRDPQNVSVEFNCKTPQDFFTVEIIRDIDCAKTSCSSDILQTEFSMFPDFNRTFIWDLKVVPTQAFQLDFPEPGMRQIPNKHFCPDKHTYSVVTYLRTGPATIGTFCKGGAVSSVLVRYKGRMFLEVPGGQKLDPVDFKFSHGPHTDKVAILKVNLPRGVANTTFITPNYPGEFPDQEEMQWDFVVPGMHNYSMTFTDFNLPECLSGDVVLEYHRKDKSPAKFSLMDPQPKHQQGNFNMVLKNCATNKTLQGLTLDFKVSVTRSGHPVLCTVDLTQRALSVLIEKVGSDPYCEMTIDSKHQTKINVASGTKTQLSFLDCPNEDLQLTTSQVIECQNASSCPGHILTSPKLDSCLPMPLHSTTWRIVMPEDSTVDLVSPTGSLQQSLPGQDCSGSVLLHLESLVESMGDFCFNGPIQKVQAHTNISVTATARDFKRVKGHFLNVSFSPEIPETIIYRVSPDPRAPTLLATPNWPRGMNPSTTVSWILTLPGSYQALLHFPNVSQPKCGERHTSIKVHVLGNDEELMSRREDEAIGDKLLVPHSFYLNMSNCAIEEGEFGAVVKIVLQKKSNLLAIVLGIAGALLLLLVVLVVVCVVTKKKKQQMSKESSIYMGKGNIFRPNDRTFSKSRSDNDSHVYASIDETLTYGHLLGDATYSDAASDHYKGIQTDSYHTFTGPANAAALPAIQEPDAEPELDGYRGFLEPSFVPPRPRTPIDRQDSLGFQDRRMVDNELYTFKSTGDINTIRLSKIDPEPEPPTDTATEEL
ncbi:CUB domain-containing protein 1 [Eucyclogobius newberryi]|uniref:CUB domain-containing protein 1 n=1 Tax=Eucyclogobius newberryi TaxID=166745 RepID=UPI003B5A092C